MARVDVYNLLRKKYNPNFDYNNLKGIPLGCLFSMDDIKYINGIVNSVKLTAKTQEKYKLIDEVMNYRGFAKMSSGTNRVCYKFLEDQRIVVKVAFRRTGLSDNRNEFVNQNYLKPFCCKCFETTMCGTIAEFEKVEPIVCKEEFKYIAEDVFDLLNKKIDGRYILEDIGSDSFLNYGIRKGFGPVILDYAYVYEIDGDKLFCTAPDKNNPSIPCGGEIDYDVGFNEIHCTKCGKKYFGTELAKVYHENEEIITRKGEKKMIIEIREGNDVINRKEFGKNSVKEEKFFDGDRRSNGYKNNNRSKKNNKKNSYKNQSYNNRDNDENKKSYQRRNDNDRTSKYSVDKKSNQDYDPKAVQKAVAEVENIPEQMMDDSTDNSTDHEVVNSYTIDLADNNAISVAKSTNEEENNEYNSKVSMSDVPEIKERIHFSERNTHLTTPIAEAMEKAGIIESNETSDNEKPKEEKKIMVRVQIEEPDPEIYDYY